jgi:hypothetical protein
MIIQSGNGSVSMEQIRWDDIRVPATLARLAGAGNPEFKKFRDNGAASVGVNAFAFDKAIEEYLMFILQIPHGYKLATNLDPHVHWGTDTTKTGTVRWGLEYTKADINSNFPLTTLITADAVISADSQYKHLLQDFAEIDGSNILVLSNILMGRVYRDATADNFDDDAFLFEIDFHCQKDDIGSRQEYVK